MSIIIITIIIIIMIMCIVSTIIIIIDITIIAINSCIVIIKGGATRYSPVAFRSSSPPASAWRRFDNHTNCYT